MSQIPIMIYIIYVVHYSLQAKLALDQFHTTDRANRQQYFHLNSLEPRKPGRPIYSLFYRI